MSSFLRLFAKLLRGSAIDYLMAVLYATEYTSLSSSPGFSTVSEWPPCSALYYPTSSHLDHQIAAPPSCMPQGIRLVNTGFHVTAFCCRASISKGTRFGPYRGRVVQPSQIKEGENNEFLWEVSTVKHLM